MLCSDSLWRCRHRPSQIVLHVEEGLVNICHRLLSSLPPELCLQLGRSGFGMNAPCPLCLRWKAKQKIYAEHLDSAEVSTYGAWMCLHDCGEHTGMLWGRFFTQGGAGSETCVVSPLTSWRTQTLSGRMRRPEHSRYKKTCYAQGHTEIDGRGKEGNTDSLAFRSGHLPSSNSKCPWHNTSSPFRRIQCHLCSMWLSRSKLKISRLCNKGKLMLTTCSLLGTLQASNWF